MYNQGALTLTQSRNMNLTHNDLIRKGEKSCQPPTPRLPLFRIASTLCNALVAGLLVAAILTALLTFVVMPHYTGLAQKWLYEEAE